MSDDRFRRGGFPTTRITLIEAARGEPSSEALEALSVLCAAYWYPTYAFIRRLGYSPEDAEDLTQGFFTRVMEKQYLRDFQRERGRFRSFLLGAVKHFVANERDWSRAQKRGGACPPMPLEDVLRTAEGRYRVEPRHDLTPEKVFERQWALALLKLVEHRLQVEAARSGKDVQFARLKGFLTPGDGSVGYRALADDLEVTEGAIKVAIHRLRARFRELLREEIARTVADPAEVGAELRHLMDALRS